MINYQFDVPIVIIIYNRPLHTEKLWAAVSSLKPKELIVIADGPKGTFSSDDGNLCLKARNVFANLDPDINAFKLYASVNMGLKARIESGLDWVFERFEYAIILEDDCIPTHEWFWFARSMLERYKHNKSIFHVTAQNLSGGCTSDASYYFSKYCHCWGWATWADRWVGRTSGFVEFINNRFLRPKGFSGSWIEWFTWTGMYRECLRGELQSWNYPWQAYVWANSGMSIVPCVNMVKNIGFGFDATNTTNVKSSLSNMSTGELNKLIDPKIIQINQRLDDIVFEKHYANRFARLLGALNFFKGFKF